MITVNLESDGVALPKIDNNWILGICENILTDFKHSEAVVTIIFFAENFLDRILAKFGISECLSLNSYLNSYSLITNVFTFLYLNTV